MADGYVGPREGYRLKNTRVRPEIRQRRERAVGGESAAEEYQPAKSVLDGAGVSHRDFGRPCRVSAKDENTLSELCHEALFYHPRRALGGDTVGSIALVRITNLKALG